MDKIEREHPNDPILNSPAFKAMSRKKLFQVYRVSGIKESAFLEKKDDDSLIIGTVNDQGETYGDLNPKEFAAAMINAYLGSFNDSKGTVDSFEDDDGNDIVRTDYQLDVYTRGKWSLHKTNNKNTYKITTT